MRVSPDGWFHLRVPVRFRDLDAMGHAHHTLPLIYLEETRAAFWRELTGSASLDAIDYVMAEITVRFHARIGYPAEVDVALAVDHVGEKSFSTVFELRDGAGELLSSGRAVQVAYDYANGAAAPIRAEVRDVLGEWYRAAQKSRASDAEIRPMKPPST